MRIGQNPAKALKEVAKPARVTVAVLNYIPFLSGFYADMLDVLKACLGSVHASTDAQRTPFDLLVFDNGSCEEVQQYLLDEQSAGRLQYLFLSEKNLGKGGAWNVMLGGAPGEIIAYADNDVLFHPGWLAESLKLLETFPKVGMVTARPYFSKKEYLTSTFAWAESTSEVTLEHGQFIPWEPYAEFNRSLGMPEDEMKSAYEKDVFERLTYQGVSAIAGASHWQFVAYKTVIQGFLPFSMDRPMGQVKQLDQRMNESGFLRLMTTTPLASNMSNTLRNVPGMDRAAPAAAKAGGRLADWPPVQKILLAVYDRIFRLYYDH
jgi:hypothetical protein